MTEANKYEAIVIGASLGGMDAIIQILSCLPNKLNFAFIIVLHRLKDSRSALIELVDTKSKIPVKEADEKEPILPGKVYIAPANYHLLVESDKTFSLDVSERINYSRPSIDVTFETAAETYKEKLIGIVLTGANQDGSNGLKKVSGFGGLTIVQDPKEAASAVMPQAAIKAAKVDHILPLADICKFLADLAGGKLNE